MVVLKQKLYICFCLFFFVFVPFCTFHTYKSFTRCYKTCLHFRLNINNMKLLHSQTNYGQDHYGITAPFCGYYTIVTSRRISTLDLNRRSPTVQNLYQKFCFIPFAQVAIKDVRSCCYRWSKFLKNYDTVQAVIKTYKS